MNKLTWSLSVFFPAYNEEGNLENTVLSAKKVLEGAAEEWEIIIVDDGSKDKTPEIASKLAEKDKRIKVVTHKPNKGYGGALKSGFSKAIYPWIAFSDSDGQFDFSEIKKFLPLAADYDLILGYRLNRADPFVRKVYTFFWSRLLPKILWGLDVRDYSCGFKLIKKSVYNAVLPLEGEEKVTQIELLVKAKRLGFKFAEVGVHHYPRKSGNQTGANLKVVLRSIVDLYKLWKKLK
ncbi:glycosyltransferase family 2 protein [Candidatus Woesebacteria bacterium]|nr:glycosyltransferase family 2 protein [Candidatus Woesebacteria bacterium]